LEALFYGNGESAKYAALKAFADAGVDALDVLAVVGEAGGLFGVVAREAVGEGESPTEAVYELVAADLGKLVFVFTQAELPIVLHVPDELGSAGVRVEAFAAVAFDVTADPSLLVPGGLLAESRDDHSLVVLTKTSDGGGEASEEWLLSGDLAFNI